MSKNISKRDKERQKSSSTNSENNSDNANQNTTNNENNSNCPVWENKREPFTEFIVASKILDDNSSSMDYENDGSMNNKRDVENTSLPDSDSNNNIQKERNTDKGKSSNCKNQKFKIPLSEDFINSELLKIDRKIKLQNNLIKHTIRHVNSSKNHLNRRHMTHNNNMITNYKNNNIQISTLKQEVFEVLLGKDWLGDKNNKNGNKTKNGNKLVGQIKSMNNKNKNNKLNHKNIQHQKTEDNIITETHTDNNIDSIVSVDMTSSNKNTTTNRNKVLKEDTSSNTNTDMMDTSSSPEVDSIKNELMKDEVKINKQKLKQQIDEADKTIASIPPPAYGSWNKEPGYQSSRSVGVVQSTDGIPQAYWRSCRRNILPLKTDLIAWGIWAMT